VALFFFSFVLVLPSCILDRLWPIQLWKQCVCVSSCSALFFCRLWFCHLPLFSELAIWFSYLSGAWQW